jgi:ankyrin repeat protein
VAAAIIDVVKAHKLQTKEGVPLVKELLTARDQHGFTPFELAIARGSLQCAELFLANGGIPAPKDDEEVYEGLDVGGKKMDWALERG